MVVMESERMVNNTVAVIGIIMYLLGMYLHLYGTVVSKIGIPIYLIGAFLIMLEFYANTVELEQTKGE